MRARDVLESPARTRFAALLARPVLPLDEAALAIAEEEYPDLDAAPTLAALDRLAARVRTAAGPSPRAAGLLRALRAVLFEEEGLRGNAEQYDDPRNSFLNDVVARKLGIPISLSVVAMEVGRRAGLVLQGVGYPGHFLAKYAPPGGPEVFVDAFHGGALLTGDEVLERIRRPEGIPPDRALLAAVGVREILSRMLRNLLDVSQEAGDPVRSYWVVDRLVLLSPDSPGLVRDRGLAAANLGANTAAIRDLERYLAREDDPEDEEEVREAIDALRGRDTFLN